MKARLVRMVEDHAELDCGCRAVYGDIIVRLDTGHMCVNHANEQLSVPLKIEDYKQPESAYKEDSDTVMACKHNLKSMREMGSRTKQVHDAQDGYCYGSRCDCLIR